MFLTRSGLLSLLLSAFMLCTFTACDSGDDEGPNDDIPADPGTTPPPLADGPLIPSITLGDIDPSNPARIPLVIGGVAYDDATGTNRLMARSAGPDELVVVEYTDENLTIVVDGVVQGKLISESSADLKADIAFIVDNTGSMGGEITGVRASILDFLNQIEAAGQDISAGIVAYNDNLPESFDSGVPVSDTRAHAAVYGFEDLSTDFTMASPLVEFIENLPATGGGDGPELAFGGLDYARRAFSWRSDAQRIYILITDATAWGRGFTIPNSKGIDEDYFTDVSLGELVRDAGSVIHVYSPDRSAFPPTAPEYDVRALADLTGGIWNELDRSGEFDLTELGIIETTLASSLIEMERDDDSVRARDVRVHVRVTDGERLVDGERTVRLTF